MKNEHDYTVKTYYDTTDEEYILRESESFFANKYCIYDGQDYFFEERNKISRGEKVYICGFCKHKLRICGGQGNKKQTLHFRHYSGENKGCIYEEKEKKLTKEEVLRIKYNGAKESKKHEDYKHFIAERLLAMTKPRLSKDKVLVEKIYRDKCVPREWRRPDVLALFPDKTIAFELQLSTTFLSVITEREAFYKEHQIFIFWIFDSFSAESEKQLFAQKDILVSNVYNVFVLDKEAMELSIQESTIYLRCYYVDFYIKNGKIADDKMNSQLVSISDLNFRETDYKVFYVDAIEQRNKLEIELKQQQKEENLFSKLKDTDFLWDMKELKDEMESLDVVAIFPKMTAILDQLMSSKWTVPIENGISLTELLRQHSSLSKNKEFLTRLTEYKNYFQTKICQKHIDEILLLLEDNSFRAIYEIKTLNDKESQELFRTKIQTLIDKILDYNYQPRQKSVSIARFILRTASDYLPENAPGLLYEMIEQERMRDEQLVDEKSESDIDYYMINRTIEQFISYYYTLEHSGQQSITKVLIKKYKKLFFHPEEETVNTTRFFYLNLLNNPAVWFDIRLLFEDNQNNLLKFTEIKRYEEDSSQRFFAEIIYYLFKAGYRLSAPEKKSIINQLTKLYQVIKVNKPIGVKNEVLKYSLLFFYQRIQDAGLDLKTEYLYYKQLHDHWAFISRIASVFMNFIINCDLANIASITANVKEYHLEYAHLFILAAESERGKKNKYKGKKGDNLEKLKEAMKNNPQYKKNEELDKLIPTLFPNAECFKKL